MSGEPTKMSTVDGRPVPVTMNPVMASASSPSIKAASPSSAFKLEAVVVCDKYADFLRHTLPQNKFLFDRLVVVTSWEDIATRKLCEFYHVQCIPTDLTNSRKGIFTKGAAINEGLRALAGSGWVVHMDADMWLPPQTRLLLEKAQLDPTMIYGIDRFIVRGADAWDRFLEQPDLQHEAEAYIHMGAFPLGTRVMQGNADGYMPIGFFQLWHPVASGVRHYPEGHTDAGREDGMFAMNWPRAKRAMVPEIIGYHLESDDASNAINWGGRKSAPFRVSR